MREAAAAVWQALHKANLEIPSGKCKGPSREVKSLGTWWIECSAAISLDTLSKIKKSQMSQAKKELEL